MGVTVTYVHRGVPGDLTCVYGEDIIDLGRSFFSTPDGTDTVSPDKKDRKGWGSGFSGLAQCLGSLQFGQLCMKVGKLTPHLRHLTISTFFSLCSAAGAGCAGTG